MALKIVEFFGYVPSDPSANARSTRQNFHCPFIDSRCTKRLRGEQGRDTPSGVCTVRQANSGPVICCPKRLYAVAHRILQDIANAVFGPGILFVPGNSANMGEGQRVLAFGSAIGGEVKLPTIEGRGGFFVDWILALVDAAGELQEFVAVEVQSIDTTGNYRQEREAYLGEQDFQGYSKGGINWENVNKRILPQLIYKGHVLRQEVLCKSGLFFVCPTPVYQRIATRVGGKLRSYPTSQLGRLSFRWYDIGPEVPAGELRELAFGGQYTTSVEELAYAFLSPGNLPQEGSYERAIRAKLRSMGV